jgi:hypothetical protein
MEAWIWITIGLVCTVGAGWLTWWSMGMAHGPTEDDQ